MQCTYLFFVATATSISRILRSAYEHMIAEQYPNEEIEDMRRTLKYEDWIDNPELPEGWKIKPTEHKTYYMDRGGQLFNSSVQAAKFVAKYAQFFSQEDIEKINKIARINQPLKVGLFEITVSQFLICELLVLLPFSLNTMHHVLTEYIVYACIPVLITAAYYVLRNLVKKGDGVKNLIKVVTSLEG